MAAGVAAEVLDLVIDAFGKIGRAQVRMGGWRIFDEAQVIGRALFQMFDPGFVVGPESIEHSPEPALSAFEAAGGLNLPPGISKEAVVFKA